MADFPLLPIPTPEISDRPSGKRRGPKPKFPGRARQGERLQPIFQRLQSVFDDNRDPLSLRNDPTAIAPERALVFEVVDSIDRFAEAVKKVPGLEYFGEEEISFTPDEGFGDYDKPVDGRLYLSMPDVQALQELVNLWNRYQEDHPPEYGFRPWYDVFEQLHDLRPWGPSDRIPEDTITYIQAILESDPDSTVCLEAEFWNLRNVVGRNHNLSDFGLTVKELGGKIIDQASIKDIAYEAALIDIPAKQALILIQQEEGPLTIRDDIRWIRPQTTVSFPTEVEALDENKVPTPVVLKYDTPVALKYEHPIVALLDGVPIQNHSYLVGRVILDDPDDLEYKSTVAKRRHGTEMASLILNGDLNLNEPPLQRPIYIRPVLYATDNQKDERPRKDRLLIDTIYKAIIRMKEGNSEEAPTAPDVFIINLSLGDHNRPFAGIISPWARLLDYLADYYGILFIVSAGNIRFPLEILDFKNSLDWAKALPEKREESILKALHENRSQRTLLSPAEALNVITVGSWYNDAHTSTNTMQDNEPYIDSGPNITSAMGLGYRKAIKPDILMPGGKEKIMTFKSGKGLIAKAQRSGFGLKVASPSTTGRLNEVGLTHGTSSATALATRAAYRIFDSLLENGLLKNVDAIYRGVIVKALLAHTVKWKEDIGQMLDNICGPHGRGKHVQRKDNIASILGFGCPSIEESIRCAPNRATLVGYGVLDDINTSHLYRVPLPVSLESVTEPRSVTLTLAWFSPINSLRRDYRQTKLEIKQHNFEDEVGVSRTKTQPSDKSIPRGTLFHVHYKGERAVPFVEEGYLRFKVFCRTADNKLDKPVRYGVAVTIEAGEHIPVYQEVKERLAVRPRVTG